MDPWLVPALELAACAVGAGLVAATEVAFSGLPKVRIQQALRARLAGARALAHVMESPAMSWSALQLLRMLFLVGAGVSGLSLAIALDGSLPETVVAATLAVAFWVFTYLSPRSLAKAHALTWARLTVYVLRIATLVLWPLVWPLSWLGSSLGIWLGGAPTPYWTADELIEVATKARAESGSAPSEDLLDSIIQFSDTTIREIMVPRTDMTAIPLDCTGDEVRTVLERGHSRIPAFDGSIDNIVGVLHVKELFSSLLVSNAALPTVPLDLRSLLRPTFYVPEVMKISELLREFQRRKTHMAIVVDEYGGTAGVVTLEDIIEEIVGEIHDEHDVEEKQYRVLSDTKILADARVPIYELQDVLGVSFPEDGDFETLAGFLMFRAGTVPEPGHTIVWNGLRFTVKEGNQKRIATVEIERPSGTSGPGAAGVS